jgi:hypothetical protein
MRSPPTIFIISLGFIGCSSSYIVSSSSEGKLPSFSDFNAAAKDEKATIVFHDDSVTDAQDLRADPDSTHWLDPLTSTPVTLSTHRIKKIIFTSRIAGAFDGARIGALSGSLAGILTAAIAVKHTSGGSSQYLPPGLAYLLYPMIGGCVGVIPGAIIGAVIGHTDEYGFAETGSEHRTEDSSLRATAHNTQNHDAHSIGSCRRKFNEKE